MGCPVLQFTDVKGSSLCTQLAWPWALGTKGTANVQGGVVRNCSRSQLSGGHTGLLGHPHNSVINIFIQVLCPSGMF
jgi:hypothetical protein